MESIRPIGERGRADLLRRVVLREHDDSPPFFLEGFGKGAGHEDVAGGIKVLVGGCSGGDHAARRRTPLGRVL
jgi:hypothetical protein